VVANPDAPVSRDVRRAAQIISGRGAGS
jgi:hypothetical protein